MISRYAEAGVTDGVLTGQQVQGFRRDGYVIVPGLFGPAEIEQVSVPPNRPGIWWQAAIARKHGRRWADAFAAGE